MVCDTVISSINDLLYNLKSSEKMFLFRGQRDSTWSLLPSAYREGADIEHQRAQRFKHKAPMLYEKCPEATEYGKWLPIMQHYGAPTRLLDWTESPLCALFFAIEKNDATKDAALYVLDAGAWNKSFCGWEVMPLIDSTTNEQIKCICANAFSGSRATNYPPVVVGSAYTSARMMAQMSWYTIHDTQIPMNTIPQEKSALRKLIIPKSDVSNIRAELSILGIRWTTIFPDLDHLGKEVAALKQL